MRLIVVVEGQTEEAFVTELLERHSMTAACAASRGPQPASGSPTAGPSARTRRDPNADPASITRPKFSAPGVDFSAPGVAFSAPGVDFFAPGVDFFAPGVAFSAPGVPWSPPTEL